MTRGENDATAVVLPAEDGDSIGALRLLRPVDLERDHVRGGEGSAAPVVVAYQDFLCPYCRRLRDVFKRLRAAFGDRLVYVFRHFPNERAHPGAELVARASEAAAAQGRFWEMHDRLFDREPPIAEADVFDLAGALGLDLDRFARDLASEEVRARVEQDRIDARRNGVTGTPTLFVDGIRYDGAWDFFSMIEALERPVAARVQRSARVFAALPTSAGLVLLGVAVLAIVAANTSAAPLYERIMSAPLVVGPPGSLLSLTVREWFSEGLLAVFFLLVGVEIRREMTVGALADRRAAILPIVAACGGVVAPALIYLAFNRGPAAHGWSVPTATDIAFTLGILAVLGTRIPTGLRVFVAALAVVDDVLSVLTLAIFYPRSFDPVFLLAVLGGVLALVALNRARVFAIWPYAIVSVAVWASLHASGVHAALAGVIAAMCLPTRPPPMAAPLLAQAATALAELEHGEREARRGGRDDWRPEREPVWDWAARNLSAVSARLLSPADRVERAVAPWSAYLILPLFAFSATGVSLATDFSSRDARWIFAGVLVALVLGKPIGVLAASGLAIATRLAVAPEGVSTRHFVGAACLCGVSDTMALLMADRAFANPADASVAKVAVLAGSALAGVLGALVLRGGSPSRVRPARCPRR
jgi:NhaA family Na+:H+ antiporter